MRILLDTNIIIPLEDSSKVLESSFSEFYKLAIDNNHQLLVHPSSIDDIQRDQKADRRLISISRIQKYPILEDPPICNLKLKSTSANEIVDNNILCAIYKNAAHLLISEDRGIHKKAKELGISDKVFYVQQAAALLNRLHNRKQVFLPNIISAPLHNLNLRSSFFDSLRQDYEGFDSWFISVSREGRNAWVTEKRNSEIGGICIYKEEDNPIVNTSNLSLPGRVLKLSTFKVGEKVRGRKLGELFLKAAFQYATKNKFEHIYITVRPIRQKYLENLLLNFGFNPCGFCQSRGANELDSVFVKKQPLKPPSNGISPLTYHIKYFPHFIGAKEIEKFIIPIIPTYHEMLFPEQQKQVSIFANATVGNAIKLAYLCHAKLKGIRPGDILLFYRSRDSKSVTSIGIVEEALNLDNPDEIAHFASKRTVYSYEEIKLMAQKQTKVILFRLATHLEKPVSYNWLLTNGLVNGYIQTIRSVPHNNFLKFIKHFQIPYCQLEYKPQYENKELMESLLDSLNQSKLVIALFSIKPHYASLLINGEKKFEYRVKPIDKDLTHLIIYSTSPVKKIIGIGIVERVKENSPTQIWEMTKHAAGISRQGFREYFNGRKKAYAIGLKTVIPLARSIDINEMETNVSIPQSFSYVDRIFLNNLINIGLANEKE